MESKKNEKWEKFFFEIYERIAREDYITLIYITCIKLIFHWIKPKSQDFKKKTHQTISIKKDLIITKIRWK